MNTSIEAELNGRVAQFAADITQVLKRAVAEAVADALPSSRPAGGRAKASVGPPSRRRTGKSVSPDTLLAEVKKKADLRMEEIAARLGTSTGALRPPMLKLLEEKKVKRTGQARGTKYRAA